jgi:hypothetical protein
MSHSFSDNKRVINLKVLWHTNNMAGGWLLSSSTAQERSELW